MTDAARATARPRIRPSAEPPTRHIEVVATRGQRRARPRTVYAVIVVGGLFAVLLAQLLLSIGLSDGAYAIQSLQQQQKELDRTHQSLTEDVDRLSSPQNLARNAQALGMVASASPSFLSLDGTIQGTPQAKDGATTALTADTLIGNSLLSGVPLPSRATRRSARPRSRPRPRRTVPPRSTPARPSPAPPRPPAG